MDMNSRRTPRQAQLNAVNPLSRFSIAAYPVTLAAIPAAAPRLQCSIGWR
jgi:hypothetical protein